MSCGFAHVNYAKNILERPAILELLVLDLFRAFTKIEFSIDRSFKNCFIFLKAFWDNSENSTLILTSFTKKGPNDKKECEGWIYLPNIKRRKTFLIWYSMINFPNLFRNRTEWPLLLRKQYFMLATLNNCLAIFASNHKVVFYLAMTHSAIQRRVHNR